VDSED
jgi:alpha-tubulin suppressor-like RCC1 family protein